MQCPNYYEILGVSVNASREDIVRAYRRLALRFHPDVQPPERRQWAGEQMKRINEAYAVLGDPEARTRYNTILIRALDMSFSGHRSHGQRRKRMVRIVFWGMALGALALGMYAYTFDWAPLFQGSLTALEELGVRLLFMQVWWAVLAAVMLKIIPLRK